MQEATLSALHTVVNQLVGVAKMVEADGRAALAENDHVGIITHYDQLRKVNATIKEARTVLSEIEESFSKEHIPNVMSEQGVKSINLIGIGRVTVSHKFSCSIITPDKTVGHDWLKANDAASLVTETVNSSTLAAYAKDIVVNHGGSLPDDIFKVGTMPYTSIVKA